MILPPGTKSIGSRGPSAEGSTPSCTYIECERSSGIVDLDFTRHRRADRIEAGLGRMADADGMHAVARIVGEGNDVPVGGEAIAQPWREREAALAASAAATRSTPSVPAARMTMSASTMRGGVSGLPDGET